MSEKLSEKQIWLNFRQGSKEAYAFIYESYFFQLFNYGRQYCNNKEMVKDCIQELFVEIWYKRKNLGETDTIKFYLFKSLKRKIIRKIKQHPYLSAQNPIITQQDEQERMQKIRSAVNTLSAQQREVIFLILLISSLLVCAVQWNPCKMKSNPITIIVTYFTYIRKTLRFQH